MDSLQLTTGMGEMVLAACEMRDEGKDAASIAQAMQDLIGRVNVSLSLIRWSTWKRWALHRRHRVWRESFESKALH